MLEPLELSFAVLSRALSAVLVSRSPPWSTTCVKRGWLGGAPVTESRFASCVGDRVEADPIPSTTAAPVRLSSPFAPSRFPAQKVVCDANFTR